MSATSVFVALSFCEVVQACLAHRGFHSFRLYVSVLVSCPLVGTNHSKGLQSRLPRLGCYPLAAASKQSPPSQRNRTSSRSRTFHCDDVRAAMSASARNLATRSLRSKSGVRPLHGDRWSKLRRRVCQFQSRLLRPVGTLAMPLPYRGAAQVQ